MPDQNSLLKRALVLNADFSALCGLALSLAREPLAAWLGVGQPRILLILGLGLLAFAGHLFWASRRRVTRLEGLYFVASDALWVVGTAAVLVGFPTELSPVGRAVAVGVALVVGLFAVLQARGLAATGAGRA